MLLHGVIRDDKAANNGEDFNLQKPFGPETFEKNGLKLIPWEVVKHIFLEKINSTNPLEESPCYGCLSSNFDEATRF